MQETGFAWSWEQMHPDLLCSKQGRKANGIRVTASTVRKPSEMMPTQSGESFGRKVPCPSIFPTALLIQLALAVYAVLLLPKLDQACPSLQAGGNAAALLSVGVAALLRLGRCLANSGQHGA